MNSYQLTVKKTFTNKNKVDKKILVVEDDDISFILLNEILSLYSINSIRANNGSEAIDFFKSDKDAFDLVLMDIRMPKVNGYEATRQIKEINPTVPVLAVTAYTHAQGVIDCYNSGCDDYISKPFDVSGFITMVKNYIALEN